MSAHRITCALERIPAGMPLGGKWRAATDGATYAVEDPATERELARVPDGGPQDSLGALEAAAGAQEGWAATPPRQRAELLRRAFEGVVAEREELAVLISLESGKPLPEARAEVTYGAEFLRWFSEEAVRTYGRYSEAPMADARLLTQKRPVGPCVLITPWNFPLAMLTRKLAPALAAGCTAVVKPAAQTPLTALRVVALLEAADLPPGVANLVTTSRPGEVVSALVADGRARKLSFTGSTEVGRVLLGQCADQVMRTSMELGGNAPLVVFEDADLDVAVREALVAKMRNTGQSCIAANRIYVQEAVAAEFVGRLADALSRLRAAPALDGGEVGPLIDAGARSRVDGLVREAINRGAAVATGAQALDRAGHFYAPTLLTGVPAGARILEEEIFGPVAALVTFRDEAAVVRRANATPYGLVAYLFTTDLDRAWRVADRLETGMAGVNRGVVSNAAAPFGGTKHSGLGREGGPEGIEEYLETRYVLFTTPPAPTAMCAKDDRP